MTPKKLVQLEEDLMEVGKEYRAAGASWNAVETRIKEILINELGEESWRINLWALIETLKNEED